MKRPRPVRVAFVTASLDSGGSERQMLALAKSLPEAHFHLEFVLLVRAGTQGDVARAIGASIHVVGFRPVGIGPWALLPFRALLRVFHVLRFIRLVRRGRYDVVDAWLYHAYVLAGLTRPLTQVRVLVAGRRSLSDYKERFGWLSRLLDRTAYRAADILVANSSAVAHDVIARERVDPSRIRIIRNGVDLADPPTTSRRVEIRRRWGATDDDVVIGCVSNYKLGKGLELLVAVAEIVCRECPAARFVLIGEGPLRARLAAGITARDLAGRVVLHGAEPDARDILPGLDIFVQPSESEGLPNVVLEAAAAGLPVVATDAGGTREIVDHGESGLIVPIGDGDALARGLRQLAEDRAARDSMGRAARTKVAREFANERFVGEVAALYNELLTMKGGRR